MDDWRDMRPRARLESGDDGWLTRTRGFSLLIDVRTHTLSYAQPANPLCLSGVWSGVLSTRQTWSEAVRKGSYRVKGSEKMVSPIHVCDCRTPVDVARGRGTSLRSHVNGQRS